jgi:hypothetical protein
MLGVSRGGPCDRRNDQVIDAARFKQGGGAKRPISRASHQKFLEIKAVPSSVPARESWAQDIVSRGDR